MGTCPVPAILPSPAELGQQAGRGWGCPLEHPVRGWCLIRFGESRKGDPCAQLPGPWVGLLGQPLGSLHLADGRVGVKQEPPHFPMGLPICPGTLTTPFPFPNSLGGVAQPSLGFSCDLRVSWCLATVPPPASLLAMPGRAQPPCVCFQQAGSAFPRREWGVAWL